jgi:tetratricopeptide (TPR) repeat protein
MGPPEVAAQIARRPATAVAVASALDDWAQETQDSGTLKRLLEAARLADPDPWRNQLRQLTGQKDLDALRKLASEAELSALPVQSLQLMGNALAFAGDSPASIGWLRRAHRQYPGDTRISFDLALRLGESKSAADLVDALRFAEAALASRPSPAMYDFVGNILYRLGRHDEAVACVRKAIEITPNYTWDDDGLGEAYKNLGYALVGQLKPDEAIPCFHKAIELKPTDWAYQGLGDAFAAQGKPDDAIACYRKAIELNPQWSWPHGSLGDVLAAQGKLDEAIVWYQKSIELEPQWNWPRLKLGHAFTRKGDAAGAVAAYRKVIEIASDHKHGDDNNLSSDAYKCLGEALAVQGQPDEAIICYRKAIELNPRWSWPHCNLGDVLAAQGKLDEAIVCYQKSIELDPQWNWPHRLKLGQALMRKGDAAGAVAAYRKVIEIASDRKHEDDNNLSSDAYKCLGEALAVQGQPDEAIDCYRKAIELNPQWSWPHCSLGDVLAAQGKLDEAIVCYRMAIELNLKWSWPRLRLANALDSQAWALATDSDAEKRDPDRAVEMATEAVELEPTAANYWNTLGVAQYRAGHWQEAINSLQKFRELRTNDGEWSNPLFLAMAHGQLGNKEEARQWHDKGTAWMAKNQHPEDLLRFRAEAAELLAIETQD